MCLISTLIKRQLLDTNMSLSKWCLNNRKKLLIDHKHSFAKSCFGSYLQRKKKIINCNINTT